MRVKSTGISLFVDSTPTSILISYSGDNNSTQYYPGSIIIKNVLKRDNNINDKELN
jgi:hypothetical protein